MSHTPNRANKEINIIIEIPKESNIKYEYDRGIGTIVVDRILRDGFAYPANYGFIPNTIDWDGDELDILVYSDESFVPGSMLKARIVGALEMIDDGETDTKLIAVHADDYRLDTIHEINDLPREFLSEVRSFFENYKGWKRPGIVQLGDGWKDPYFAFREYEECHNLWKSYKDLTKDQFLSRMKELHPEKYTF